MNTRSRTPPPLPGYTDYNWAADLNNHGRSSGASSGPTALARRFPARGGRRMIELALPEV